MSRYTLFIQSIYKKVAVFLLLGCAISVHAGEISVSIDRNPVNLNESFQIVFSASESPDADPDFDPLLQDFEILNQSQSSQSSWINGKTSKTIQWVLQVMAKREGVVSIPAIAFGRDRSQPSSVLVKQESLAKADSSTKQDLFLQVEAHPKNPYVQSQVIYTVKLFRQVNLAQAKLSEPEIDNTVTAKLGEDKNYNTHLNGEDYIVTERQYALFPQQSGTLTIPPVSLTASVIINSRRQRFSGFFNPQTTRTRRVVSDTIELNVRARPAQYGQHHWLPAEQVYVQQEWSADLGQLKAGEPITRTITLLAKGTTVGQLPEISGALPAITAATGGQLKSYPDQPVLKEQHKADGLIAFREEKTAYIPSTAGKYQLPEITVPWWNTKNGTLEKAVLPATELTVAAATLNNLVLPSSTSEPVVTSVANTNNPQTRSFMQDSLWFWVATVLAGGWVATLVYFLTRRQPIQPGENHDEGRIEKQLSIYKALKKACQNNDAHGAKDALIRWGQEQFNVSSLGKISCFCEPGLGETIQSLNAHLYSETPIKWDASKLLQQFNRQPKVEETLISKVGLELEPLHRL